ncbi:ABC transporter substrate-binding protein [Paenibacillus hodogayensis]|uniref:ABC transporter substrate-binding protein n=1 Tax=Paenibacillus hodogayensis TaxID=279208 RepID=A0ABV5VXQ4_9BACL
MVFMWRKRGLFAIAMLIALLLAACSNQGKEDIAPTAVKEQPAKPVVREFEHAKGKSTIPVQPKRIVAIQYTGAMLALGVKPVGADKEWSAYPLLEKEWTGIEHVGDPWTGLNLEKIVQLNPDLIVTHVENTYEPLSKIAPTIFIPWLKYDVRQQITVFGDILGKQAEAKAWLEDFDAKAESARKKAAGIVKPNETAAIVNIRPKNQFIYGDSAMGGYVMYQVLKLTPPLPIKQKVLDAKLAQLEFSWEAVPDMLATADLIFLSVLETDGGAARAKELQESAIWKSLPAVKNNRVYHLDWNTYFTTDPLSTKKQLDAFVALLQSSGK